MVNIRATIHKNGEIEVEGDAREIVELVKSVKKQTIRAVQPAHVKVINGGKKRRKKVYGRWTKAELDEVRKLLKYDNTYGLLKRTSRRINRTPNAISQRLWLMRYEKNGKRMENK